MARKILAKFFRLTMLFWDVRSQRVEENALARFNTSHAESTISTQHNTLHKRSVLCEKAQLKDRVVAASLPL